jgi:hypothetical protein
MRLSKIDDQGEFSNLRPTSMASINGGPFKGHIWKYLYLIFGLIAVVYGIIATFILADNPLQARWLKPRERDIAVTLRAYSWGSRSASLT